MSEKALTAETKSEIDTALPVSDDEIRAAFSGPAFHANKIYLTLTKAGARMAFMEQQGTAVPPQFRTAAIMSMEDAVALKNLLVDKLTPIEDAMKSAPTIVVKGDGG